ncbi:MAG: amidohydrolase [Pseudorhodoplanes sp.]
MSNKITADSILISSNILTMDAKRQAPAAFVAIKDNRILAVGAAHEQADYAGDGTRIEDFGDRPILPGFIDAHCHMETIARTSYKYVDVRVPKCRSIAEVVETLRNALHTNLFDGWILAQANLFFDQKLSDGRLPTKKDLDAVSKDIPIMIRAGGHVSSLNSAALRIAGLTSSYVPPADAAHGKAILVMGEDGEPNGIIKDMDDLIPFPKASGPELKNAIRETVRDKFTRFGVTSICEMTQSVEGLHYMDELIRAEEMPLRVAPFILLHRTLEFEQALEWRKHLKIEVGPEWFDVKGIKLFSDGGYSSATAAVNANYVGTNSSGEMGMTAREIRDYYVKVSKAGLGVAIHANGERSQQICCEAILMDGGPIQGAPPVRLEHGGNLLPSYDEVTADWRKAGIIPVPQQPFLYALGDYFPIYLGEYGRTRRFPFRQLLDDGWEVAGSSDVSNGAEIDVTNPMLGVWCAVARKTFKGETIDPEQAVTVEEALRMYTLYSAKTLGHGDIKGSLEPGKLADIIVLDRDPRKLKGDDLLDTQVDCVFVDGKRVYERTA